MWKPANPRKKPEYPGISRNIPERERERERDRTRKRERERENKRARERERENDRERERERARTRERYDEFCSVCGGARPFQSIDMYYLC